MVFPYRPKYWQIFLTSLNSVIDSLILYTFEIGSLTGYVTSIWSVHQCFLTAGHSFATIVSMICVRTFPPTSVSHTLIGKKWLSVKNTLIFLGLHFIIAKRKLTFVVEGSRCWYNLSIRQLLHGFVSHIRLSRTITYDIRRLNTRHQLRQAHARTNSATNAVRGINRPNGPSYVRTSPHYVLEIAYPSPL